MLANTDFPFSFPSLFSMNFSPQDSIAQFSKFQQISPKILSYVLEDFSSKEKLAISRTCKQWYGVIVGTKSNWTHAQIPKSENIESAIQILSQFSKFSNQSLEVVVIDTMVPEHHLNTIFDILIESWDQLSILHLTQLPDLNTRTRVFVRTCLPWVKLLSTRKLGFSPLRGCAFKPLEATDSSSSQVFKAGSGMLRAFYTDNLEDLASEDLVWIKGVETLQFEYTDTRDSFYQILVYVKDCIRHLYLEVYENQEFDEADPIRRTKVGFPFLEFVALPTTGLVPLPIQSAPLLTSLYGSLLNLSSLNKNISNWVTHLELQLWVRDDGLEMGLGWRDPIFLDCFDLLDVLGSFEQVKSMRVLIVNPINKARVDVFDFLYLLNSRMGFDEDEPLTCPLLSSLSFGMDPIELDLQALLTFKRARNTFLNKAGGGMAKLLEITFEDEDSMEKFEKGLRIERVKEGKGMNDSNEDLRALPKAAWFRMNE